MRPTLNLRARAGQMIVLLLALGVAVVTPGCQGVRYYRQAIAGQYRILAGRKPIAKLLDDAGTAPALKEKLALVLRLREFAERELKLPVNGHYLRYVDLHRRYVVWNVHAAPEFSLQPKKWWYPVVGRLSYRGYFSEQAARDYAAGLRARSIDVYVGGVEAYSTLGWFRDPVMSSFIHHEEADLAEALFHELAHQELFLSGDTDFNEAFATAVAQEGVRRWFEAKGDGTALERYRAGLKRDEQFAQLMSGARAQLKALYGEEKPGQSLVANQAHAKLSAEEMRRGKEEISRGLRERYAQLKAQWGGYAGYDSWFKQPLNNARLNSVETYWHLVPAFERRLLENGGDLEKFFQAIRGFRGLSKTERHQRLEAGR